MTMRNRLMTLAMTGCMAVGLLAGSVSAATVSDATIDTSESGSLTIYKYDKTAAAIDGVTTEITATGMTDTEVETVYADYAVQGVEFTYLKVADITTYSETQSDGTSKIQVAYGISSKDELLTILGLDRTDVIKEDKGGVAESIYYYSSDTLIDALADLEESDLNEAKNLLEEYIVENGGTTMTETDENGMTTVSGLDLGLYLVVETAVPEQITTTVAPFFVSLPMTTNDGDEWNYDVVVYPKNQSGMPTLEKLVAEVTTGTLTASSHISNDDAYAPTATASDGDILYYQITSKLPTITSEATYLTTYTFVDTLSAGIEYVENDVVLTWYTDADCTNKVTTWTLSSEKFTVEYGTADDDATTMTIKMTKTGLAEINTANDSDSDTNYGDYYLRISYSATVNSDASVVYGEDGNPNDVVLTWQRSNMSYYDTLQDECIVYTFGLNMTKQFADGEGDYTAVSFKVQNTTDGYYLIATGSNGLYYVTGESCKTANEDEATTFVPNSTDGSLVIYGVEDDTYVITELTTDDSYTLLKDNITVVITTETTDVIFDQNGAACADGSADGLAYDDYMQTSTNAVRTASATVDANAVTMDSDGDSDNALVPLTVVNTHSFTLPQTGGAGTMAMIVGGMVAIAAAGFVGVLLLKRERKAG